MQRTFQRSNDNYSSKANVYINCQVGHGIKMDGQQKFKNHGLFYVETTFVLNRETYVSF